MRYSWNRLHTSIEIEYRLNPDLFQTAPSAEIQPGNSSAPFKPFFYLGKSSFISVEKDSSKYVNVQLSFAREADLSKLIINLNSLVETHILQLVTSDGDIVREIFNPSSKTVYFNNLQPGTYKLRAIVDSNGNGKWDPGNYKLQSVPERVIYFVPKDGNIEMQLRANFDREETFTIK